MSGKVYLVGAGPGDPSLLTLRAAQLLGRAEVVVLDALVGRDALAHVPPSARIIEAGKRAGTHLMSQDQINDLLVMEARQGRTVVRLKGGDPFIFGRGGEEAAALRASGIDFEVVPGVSSAIAGPAYAGIPVTHRGVATTVLFATAQEGDESSGIDWEFLARHRGTIVFLMGLGNLEAIAGNLQKHGRNPDTPVAVITQATTPKQRVITGTLSTIAGEARHAALSAPALVVVGEVVKLRELASWFEARPLFGKTIVVTRAREQASELTEVLREAGGNVLELPLIEIGPPESWGSLDRVIDSLASYSFVIFTSSNGVRFFFDRLFARGRDGRALADCRIAVVGSATRRELQRFGLIADLAPETFQSTALLPLLPDDLSGRQIALVRAAAGREELLDELRKRGASVDLAIAYQTRVAEGHRDEFRGLIRNGSVDAITFTSSSTVENFFRLLSEEEKKKVLATVVLASIGPTTSASLRAVGARTLVEAGHATVRDLANIVIEHLSHAP